MIRIIFKRFKGEILAIFPDEKEHDNCLMCYAHLGQHSTCSKTLMYCRNASKDEYTPLLNELVNVIGYNDLAILNERQETMYAIRNTLDNSLALITVS